MINILSLRCSLAFAPYLLEGFTEFLESGSIVARVIRQGGSGLIARISDGISLRYQERECHLNPEDVSHYLATTSARAHSHRINRMTGEIVLSDFDGNLILSHPQSELWLEPNTIRSLVQLYDFGATSEELPDWIQASVGGNGLLLSDLRNGRWVLLGSDHIAELRLRYLLPVDTNRPKYEPPTIDIKGLTVHLQSAIGLKSLLKQFADGSNIVEFEEVTPQFRLAVTRSTEGLELRDSNTRISLNLRESRKWAGYIDSELIRLRVSQIDRGSIRTVVSATQEGLWILQWGDELFLRHDRNNQSIVFSTIGTFNVVLDTNTSACVALTDQEMKLASTG